VRRKFIDRKDLLRVAEEGDQWSPQSLSPTRINKEKLLFSNIIILVP